MRRPARLLALLALLASPAAANDSIAELGAGGLVLSRSDVVEMESEDLFVSAGRIEVDYVFRNVSEADVDTIVAFPMPDIESNPWSMPAIPVEDDENFLGFSVSIDGRAIAPQLQHRAFAAGVDVTDDLLAAGVPLYPLGEAAFHALDQLDEATAGDWRDRGIIVLDEFDAGQGWQSVRTPFWLLRSTYWWRTRFPAGKPVRVHHAYTPGVGGTAGLSFFYDGKFGGETYADYRTRYCMDQSFERAVKRIAAESPDGYPPLMEQRVSYILVTGGNWSGGTIGRFRLTVDKGDAKNLVSFCGEGVKKTGPTRFEMVAEDYHPDRNLDILILTRTETGGAN